MPESTRFINCNNKELKLKPISDFSKIWTEFLLVITSLLKVTNVVDSGIDAEVLSGNCYCSILSEGLILYIFPQMHD